MKTLLYIFGILAVAFSCNTANTPNFDFGNYNYATKGVRNDLNGSIVVKTMSTGQTYADAKKNAQKKVLRDIMLKGIERGCENCIKPAIFLNQQAKESTKVFLDEFFADDKNLDLYTSISRELATWEQKRDLKFTQNQPLGFEVLVKFDQLKKVIENNKTNETNEN